MGGSSKKQTVGYKYSLGAHMGFCHGPIDKVTRIRVADRIAWEGESTGGQITIDAPSLFGGEDREGGISGLVDFEFGEPTQDVNDYLQEKQNVSGETVPAYRGIAAAVLRQVYLGTNPYLKPWEFRAQRIHTSTRGAVQWYDEKAEVPGDVGEVVSSWNIFALTLDTSELTTGMNNNSSIFVSNDGLKIFGATFVSGSTYRLQSWTMSTAYDLSAASLDSGNINIPNGTFGGMFVSEDGIHLYINRRGSTLLHYVMSIANDITTATLADSSLSIPVQRYGCFFDNTGENLYFTEGTILRKYTLTVPWNTSTASLSQSFDFSTLTSSPGDGITITGKPGVSNLYIGTSSNKLIDIQLSSDNDLSSPSLNGIQTLGTDITQENIAINNGFHFFAYPNVGGSTNLKRYDFILVIQSGDMNPAHIIRECITDTSWGMGYTDSDIDDDSFTLAADTLFDEEFGLSLLWSQSTDIEDFIRDILRHIDGTLYVHPRTGKFTLKLIRDDYTAASLPVLNESNIISISDYKKPTIGELTNYVTVKYWDRSTSEDSSISVQDIALAQQQGAVVSATIPMQGITRGSLASRVASRELTALSNPLITCTIIANREAASLNIGDAFKLTWPKFGLTETIMRVTNASFGTMNDGRVKIECVQDVFGLPNAVFSEPTDSNFVDPTNAPANSPFRLVQEANYWTLIQDQGEDFTIDPLDGYLLTAATTPSSDALNYRIWTDESGSYVEKEPANFCPTATITHDFPRVVDGVIQTVVGITGLDTDDVADIDIGSIAQIGNEFLEVVAVSTTSLTVGRAVVDSPIEDHATGDRIFFWGNSFYGFSTTLYQDNDTIDVKITPLTAQGQLDVADATEQTLTFDQRAYRAWLPGNVQLNSEYFPISVEGVESVDSAWAHRDRTLQTAGLNDFTESSIGPEVGTTYTTTLTRVNTSDQLDQNTGITGTTDSLDPAGYDGLVRYSIVSVRDSLDSYYAHEHEFIVTRTSALAEEAEGFIFTEDNEAIITES